MNNLKPIPVELIQKVRILDVVAIGPAIIWASMKCPMPGALKAFLLLTGIGTIVFNGYNYLVTDEMLKNLNP